MDVNKTLMAYGLPFSLVGNPKNAKEYASALTWFAETQAPSWSELVSEWPSIEEESKLLEAKEARKRLYIRDSDPLFFKYQRGENTKEVWLAAIAAIDEANPYPVKEEA
tara:strand:- start:2740 stop:3066 length:327 start_codon:yes stop_codon:yes gene_type:complete